MLRKVVRKLTTKQGLLGDYSYSYLFKPSLPFINKSRKTQPFFGLDSEMPLLLGIILGLQHALAMLAGVITPPLMISTAANLDVKTSEYLVSASLITSGVLTCIQISRIRIWKTRYYIGTGLLSVMGTSFAIISVVTSAFPLMYKSGVCVIKDGVKQPCNDGYGHILGTSIVCALLEILLSFIPARILRKLFPPVVTGPVVFLIGMSLVQSGLQDWLGGSDCVGKVCGSSHPLKWGSAQFLGLGFTVYLTIIICEKYGAPIMRSCSVIVGLLVGCIIAAGCGYFSAQSIDVAPDITFIWVHTFKLKVYGPLVLPLMAIYIVSMMEAIGDITATSDVSFLEVSGEKYESRIQGGILADGISGIISGLFTITPMSTFAQNNGVISITKCANRSAGFWCAFFLIVMGIFSKISSAIASIPKAVLGGMTTFLFTSVAVSGIKIISSVRFTRREIFLLTVTLVPGIGATLVPTWFDQVFLYSGSNQAKKGFLDAITLVMETGFSITGILGIIINLVLPDIHSNGESNVDSNEGTNEDSSEKALVNVTLEKISIK